MASGAQLLQAGLAAIPIKKQLGIPEGIEVEAVFPIGYEFGKNPQRKKVVLDTYINFEHFGNRKMNYPKKLEV